MKKLISASISIAAIGFFATASLAQENLREAEAPKLNEPTKTEIVTKPVELSKPEQVIDSAISSKQKNDDKNAASATSVPAPQAKPEKKKVEEKKATTKSKKAKKHKKKSKHKKHKSKYKNIV